MLSRLSPLVKLLYNPIHAMGELRARAPYAAGALLALVASLIYYDALSKDIWAVIAAMQEGPTPQGTGFVGFNLFDLLVQGIAPIAFLAVIFTPCLLFAISLVDRRSSFGVLLRQEYTTLVSCVFYSWAIAHFVLFFLSLFLFGADDLGGVGVQIAIRLVPLPYFAFLVVLGVRVVMKLSTLASLGAVALAGASLILLPIVPKLLFFLSSPFLLIIVILLLRSFIGELISGHQGRERLKRNLEAATLNPADSSAHYNLGLIYQQRGMYDAAKESYNRAVEIDPDETDAHYQLGRIAREEGRLADAIAHFDEVVRRDSEHSQNEVWREIGSTYFDAGHSDEAISAFERFLEKRGSDAEGRYRYGLALHRLGKTEEAATEMHAVVESVRTSPAYKYRREKRWMNEAQTFLRSLPADKK
ncbi:MAG TPA: tetratricopeptide repeat protein [Blastocatellia bacterium]|nr:tetratricopeptide repeat protein [Blastocatellia bacterium]